MAALDLPFLSEGAHLLSLRQPGADEEFAIRTVHVWKPEAREPGTILATCAAAVGRRLEKKVRSARIRIGGRDASAEWFCGRTKEGWSGFAWLDLTALSAGVHAVEIEPEGHPSAAYSVRKLPSSVRVSPPTG